MSSNDIYTISLHDALPISAEIEHVAGRDVQQPFHGERRRNGEDRHPLQLPQLLSVGAVRPHLRSEEHTSELQSHSDLVCRLLLEKKKIKILSYLLQLTSYN